MYHEVDGGKQVRNQCHIGRKNKTMPFTSTVYRAVCMIGMYVCSDIYIYIYICNMYIKDKSNLLVILSNNCGMPHDSRCLFKIQPVRSIPA